MDIKELEKKEIEKIVIYNTQELVDTFVDEEQFEVTKDTVLFGADSRIDSLSLVTVIVDLESTFALDYEYDISLTDDRAMTREQSPFDSVQTLVDYIDELISDN